MYNDFDESMRVYECVNAAIADEVIDVDSVSVVNESTVMQSYLDGDMTGNTDAKKLFAAALNIANEKGFFKLPAQYSNPHSIAMIADKAVETVKLAHDVASEKIDANQAVDFAVRKGAAVLKTVADFLISKGTKIVSNAVTNFVASVCPPVAVFAPVIKVGISLAGQKAKEFVKKGIDKISEVAKPVFAKFVEGGKKLAKVVTKKIGKFLFG